MKTNRSLPPSTVIPVLVYPDVREAVDWLTAAFGFVLRTRIGERHRAQLSIGEQGAVIAADLSGSQRPPQEGVVTHVLKVRVPDVEEIYQTAVAHGARVISPPEDQPYGERECTLEDPAGHRWQFSQTIRDVPPEEYGCETVSPWPGYPA